MIARRIQTSRAKLDNPNKPIGVFMLCGPSGVGKTETALALAESLYGGEQNVITINMSEFQEAHTVSTLKGSPPGYVGYGEGGMLTEAVRRRPYSVVLLDEVEKAHSDVHEIFFQVFDKGWMEDGEGRYIDFKNTIILLTSNVGTDLIMSMCRDPELMPEPEGIAKALREPLLKVFPAALLGRLVVIPYYPLSDEMLGNIVRLQLGRIAKRVERAPQDAVHLRRRRGEADREPLHRGGKRRPHDRRDPDQHGAAGDQPRVPDADDGGQPLSGVQLAAAERRLRVPVRLSTRGYADPQRRHAVPSCADADQRDEALAIGIECLKEGASARRRRRCCAACSRSCPATRGAALRRDARASSSGHSEEGIALVRESLEAAPDAGRLAQQSRHHAAGDRATSPARSRRSARAIALDPAHANAHNNLGVLLRLLGLHERGRGRVPHGDRHQPRSRRRVPQPRRSCWTAPGGPQEAVNPTARRSP